MPEGVPFVAWSSGVSTWPWGAGHLEECETVEKPIGRRRRLLRSLANRMAAWLGISSLADDHRRHPPATCPAELTPCGHCSRTEILRRSGHGGSRETGWLPIRCLSDGARDWRRGLLSTALPVTQDCP